MRWRQRAFIRLKHALHSEGGVVGTRHLLRHKVRGLGKHLLHLVAELIADALDDVRLRGRAPV